ncbi:MAG TPA: UbiD family decarboxylase [Chloroflexota bacterium]|nr:UbiD family decarboxylase [Chloroflexota bacterium]
MAFDDLRSFLDCLESRGALRRVSKEVDGDLELGAIMHEVHRRGGPAVLFERISGCDYAMVSGAIGSPEHLALALGLPNDPRLLQQKGMDAMRHPLPPLEVDSGASQEYLISGADVDLSRFPAPFWHPLDGGRYIGTFGVVITQDPETGARNAAVYREQVVGRNKTGILLGRNGAVMLQKYLAMGKPMPIATCFGVPPAVLVSAIMPVNYGEDELALAGAFLGKPLPVVKGKTVDLLVPANCEFVFEGWISPDQASWEEEGPFGEYTGYYGGERFKRPTIELTAVTHRPNPIMHGTLEGRAPNESEVIATFAHNIGVKADLIKLGVPGIKDVYARARSFITAISLERQFYAGHARQVIDAALVVCRGAKWIIVVDGDIDVFNPEDIDWAVATRVQPHRDIVITDNHHVGMVLDPSIHPDLRPNWLDVHTSKIGIDATTKYKGHDFPPAVEPDAATHARVLEHWAEYGIDSASSVDPALAAAGR